MSTNGHNHRQALPTLPARPAAPASSMPAALPPVDWAQPREEPLAEVERQLERGSQFTQAALDKLVGRLAGAEAYITELVGLLRARGILSAGDLADDDDEAPGDAGDAEALASWEEPAGEQAVPAGAVAVGGGVAAAEPCEADRTAGPPSAVDEAGGVDQAARPQAAAEIPESSPRNDHGDAELSESGTQAKVSWPGIAFRVDPENPAPSVAVNCDERMHVCHAVCCKLNFALTPAEVDEGKVKWDLGFPYMIRHGANGYCSHNDTATGRCTNYAHRPGVCHRYSCANDPRIWKDFGNMVLNEEWIRTNLANQSRITVGRALPLMEVRHGMQAERGVADA